MVSSMEVFEYCKEKEKKLTKARKLKNELLIIKNVKSSEPKPVKKGRKEAVKSFWIRISKLFSGKDIHSVRNMAQIETAKSMGYFNQSFRIF